MTESCGRAGQQRDVASIALKAVASDMPAASASAIDLLCNKLLGGLSSPVRSYCHRSRWSHQPRIITTSFPDYHALYCQL
jgi:hypothetical protein